MAFCQKCGQQTPDGSTLCEACAAAQAPAPQPEPVAVAQPEPVAAAQPEPVAAAQPAAPYFQPAYTAPRPTQPYTPPPVQQPFRIPLTQDQLPPEYKPLGAWTYFLYSLLFSLPLVGFICLIIFACGGTQNINLRNYARSHFCAYLVGLILAILLIALIVALGVSLADAFAYYDTETWMDMAYAALFR